MASFTEVAALIPTLRGHLGAASCADELLSVMSALSDAELVDVLEETTRSTRMLEQFRLCAIGVAAARSSRDRGHSGLAQARGHRSTTEFVQDITGSTRAEAAREVRVGAALVESGAGPVVDPGDGGSGTALERDAAPETAWHAPLRVALQTGLITAAQFDAIRSGLGEPPHADDSAVAPGAREAWGCAAEMLVAEAKERTVEELRSAARTVRDRLDPEGAEARFNAQYEARVFRTYRDAEGRRRGSIVFDEEGGAFVDAFMDAALRPRRGGPRFLDADEQARAADLVDDPRTNDQLAYDVLVDVIRGGVLADPETVFGTRQAGVRLVQSVDEHGNRAPIVLTEDRLVSMPGTVADRRICDSGFVVVSVDSCGKPLDVGREQRLFTTRQRIALAIRDGGCRWRGCDRPASYCEAHHIDPYAHGGRTDVDRGILLCRYHHMTLHHGGWWITRDGTGEFVLHHPTREQVVLRPRVALMRNWAGLAGAPPPKRFRPAA